MVLERVDGHAIVANSAAMKAAGVTPATQAPAGGEIHDGVFVDNAEDLIRRAIPPRTAAQGDEAVTKAQEQLLSVGVTSVGAMSVSVADWKAFRRAGQAGRLNVRLMSYLVGDPKSAEGRARSRPAGFTAIICARSGSSCSRTARWARAGRGSSNLTPTSPTRAG